MGEIICRRLWYADDIFILMNNIRKRVALYLTDKFNSAISCIIYDSVDDLRTKKEPIHIVTKTPLKSEIKGRLPNIATNNTITEEWTLQTVTATNNSLNLKFKLNHRKKE